MHLAPEHNVAVVLHGRHKHHRLVTCWLMLIVFGSPRSILVCNTWVDSQQVRHLGHYTCHTSADKNNRILVTWRCTERRNRGARVCENGACHLGALPHLQHKLNYLEHAP